MDAPRRWQVASLATAMGGLGIGSMLFDPPTSEPVAPIVLEVVSHESTDPGEAFRFPQPQPRPGPEIVTADVISGNTPISGVSVGTPDDADESSGGDDGGSDPAPTPTPVPAPVPAQPAPAPRDDDAQESADSPDDVDNDDSVDSVDSD